MNNFNEMTMEEMMELEAGGAWDVFRKVTGTVALATAPAVGVAAGVAGGPWTGIAAWSSMSSAGCALIDD